MLRNFPECTVTLVVSPISVCSQHLGYITPDTQNRCEQDSSFNMFAKATKLGVGNRFCLRRLRSVQLFGAAATCTWQFPNMQAKRHQANEPLIDAKQLLEDEFALPTEEEIPITETGEGERTRSPSFTEAV